MSAQKPVKPCPCCGGPAGIQQIDPREESENAGGYFIACGNTLCGITTSLRFACGDDPKPLLAEAWNKRALDAGVEALIAADVEYEAALEALKEINRIIAEKGWVEVHNDTLRKAGVRLVVARLRRVEALAAVRGAAG